jgi:hypothetical protein
VNRIPFLIGIAVLLMTAALALPVKQRCPQGPCATAPDARGDVHYHSEFEPLGILLIKSLLGVNIRLYYTSGEDVENVR